MPCQEIIQVVGTLIPQDMESFGSNTPHEGKAIAFSRNYGSAYAKAWLCQVFYIG
ncbi:hypothetical protein ACTWQL_23190 [Pseudalkalibacillus sp. R45]|uniref:hypothetical protein n=1 Tax=Pseudalkalibacillus sp. R45 TaxID=3457433 RepID=UPI003FCD775B